MLFGEDQRESEITDLDDLLRKERELEKKRKLSALTDAEVITS